MRSTGTEWAKNSILAVDAGVHLSAIVSLIETHLPYAIRHDNMVDEPTAAIAATPVKSKTVHHRATNSRKGYFSPIVMAQEMGNASPVVLSDRQNDGAKLVMTTGPFKDLLLPFESAKANALYLLRHLISTYLITHAHLDHLAGFAINSAAFQFTTRPKKLAALPHTINAVKSHIFNDCIWPNLSDEEGGVGLVSFQRLTEGGNLSLGDGEGRGYVEVCDGLAVKGWSISHGHCMRQHTHRGSIAQEFNFNERRGSRASLPISPGYRRSSLPHNEFIHPPQPEPCVTDSSAFFILDEHTRKEILIFGDVEPDSISLAPRTAKVWSDAAPKIVAGILQAIFIECSYDDSQPDETLFGHLAPRHLIAELLVLAEKVNEHIASLSGEKSIIEDATRKRKRDGAVRPGSALNHSNSQGRTNSPNHTTTSNNHNHNHHQRNRSSLSPHSRSRDPPRHTQNNTTSSPTDQPFPNPAPPLPTRMHISHPTTITTTDSTQPSTSGFLFKTVPLSPSERPKTTKPANFALQGLKVVVIHVKDTLRDLSDGPPADETVLMQLRQGVEEAELGVEIGVARKGDVLWF